MNTIPENPPPGNGGKKALYADPARKPAMLAVRFDAIPDVLTAAPRWVLWDLKWNGTKWDKPPLQADGALAKSNTPATWTTFDRAKAAYAGGGFTGVGFVPGKELGLALIDLDDAIDPATREVKLWARAVLDEAATYCEVSPSGLGLRVIGRGTWRGAWTRRRRADGEVEIYTRGQYLTLTGHRVPGAPAGVSDIQPLLDALAAEPPPATGKKQAAPARPPSPPPVAEPVGVRGAGPLTDAEVLEKAAAAGNGDLFSRLWSGDTTGHGGDDSAADLALMNLLAFWCRGDREQMERLFSRSGLGARDKWVGREDYRRRTIDKAVAGRVEFYDPAHPTGGGTGPRPAVPTPRPADAPVPWPDPVPLTPAFDPPPFPVDVLPGWLREFALAVAEEKQVPVDLPALLGLGATAAGVARKVVVTPWAGWSGEPTNLFVLCALPPGERKSQTFAAVFAPVNALEADLREREGPAVRDAQSDERVAKKRVDHLETRVAKCEDGGDRAALIEELKAAREELAALAVPALPLLRVDDDTPEMLAMELVRQNGRLLAASPEARTLENIDRYADKPNLDVFLKGHAGDDLRSGRVGRGRDAVDRPALTCVYAPQPCVVEGLGGTPEMRGRGFLARWLFSLPRSAVGYRKVRGAAVPEGVRGEYERCLTRAWRTGYARPEDGTPHTLYFAPEAAAEFERFEAWKEAELRPGGRLAGCGGWGNKLGGLCVRLCGVFHAADGVRAGDGWQTAPIPADVVRRAARLCREYAVPHARAAFARMGDSPAVAGAKAVLRWLGGREHPTAAFSKRDAFNGCRGAFETVDELQPALDLLERHDLIRPRPDPAARRGPGRPPSPVFEVNPAAHKTQNPHNDGCDPPDLGSADNARSASGR